MSWKGECIPRRIMPQIDNADIPGLVAFIRSQGVDIIENFSASIRTVRMVQCKKTTKKAVLTPALRAKPLIVSGGYEILDGNGRYLAFKDEDNDGRLNCVYIGVQFPEAALMMMQYPKTYTLLGGNQPSRE